MFALEIRFLTGRYAAGRHTDPSSPEWPPHPARLYSALTAVFHDDPEPPSNERDALEWLAGAGAPEVFASDFEPRHLGDVYVPTNDSEALGDIDTHLLKYASARVALKEAEGKARAKAERSLAGTEEKLRERSEATSAADGKGTPANAVEVLDRRPRHARNFPVALPAADFVHMRWEVQPPPEIATALDDLCARISRLGHSSSLVSVRTVDPQLEPDGFERWIPHSQGDRFLRVPFPNQLELLEQAHALHRQIQPRVLPAHSARYRTTAWPSAPDVDVHRPVFSDQEVDWILYEIVPPPSGGSRLLLDLSVAQEVARALRGTLLSALDGDAPEAVSGHATNGEPTSRPHVAFVPLGDIGHPHASGSILGMAIVPPRDFATQDRDRLLEAVFEAESAESRRTGGPGGVGERRLRLTLGRRGVVHIQRIREPSRLWALDAGRWCRPAKRWATATAIALGRNPGNLHSHNPEVAARAVEAAEATIAAACENVELPAPAAVWIHRRSLLEGAPSARRFMPFPTKGKGPRRVCVHAEVLFHERVAGPVMLGAGRFFGVGLCAPVRSGGD